MESPNQDFTCLSYESLPKDQVFKKCMTPLSDTIIIVTVIMVENDDNNDRNRQTHRRGHRNRGKYQGKLSNRSFQQ